MSLYEQSQIEQLRIKIRSLTEEIDRLKRGNTQRRAITGRGSGGSGEAASTPEARFIKYVVPST